MNNLLKKLTLRLNLLFLTPIEIQALEILVVLKNTFESTDYRFSQDELSSKQLKGIFYDDKDLKKLLFNDKNELKSLWDIIGFLRERGFIESSAISGYQITFNGIVKVNELESYIFSSKRFISLIGIFGGFIYSARLLIDFIIRFFNILPFK